MASSCVLQWKTLQGHGCTINPQPVSPVKDPVSKNDASAGPLRLKRSGSKSTLGTLVSPSSTGLVSAYGYKASQKEGRSATGPGLLLFGPLHMTPTQDKAYICARNVSYIHSTISLSKKTATLLLCHRRGQDCPYQGLAQRLLKDGPRNEEMPWWSCVALLQERNLTWGRTESPLQKWVTGRVSREQAVGTAQVPLHFVIPSLLCAGSSCLWFPFPPNCYLLNLID